MEHDEESQLFRELAELKARAAELRREVNACRGSAEAVRRLALVEKRLLALRNRIVEANLRLVVSIARQAVVGGQAPLYDLISEGNEILLKAVELFDVAYGTRFSTYATTAIRRRFFKVRQAEQQRQQRFVSGCEEPLEKTEETRAEAPHREIRLHRAAARLLDVLAPRERAIVEARFGLGEAPKREKLREIGARFGISRERVRQILNRALQKLHQAAGPEEAELAGE